MQEQVIEVYPKVVSRDAFKYLFKCWRILGVYPAPYFKYSFIVITLICASLPLCMTILLFELDEVKLILENLSLNMTLVVCITKYLNIIIQRNNILKIDDMLAKLDARAENPEEQAYLRKKLGIVNKMNRLVTGLYGGAGIFNGLSVFFTNGERLMYAAWYPFDWKNSRINFWIANIHQSIAIFFNVLQNVSSDTFPTFYMLVLTSHIRALNMRVRRVGTDPKKSHEENYIELVKCIQDHQLLFQFFSIVQKVTSGSIFLQFFATGIEACITAVYVLIVKGNFLDTIFLSVYLSSIILEVFLYCFFGNQLISESDRLTDAIYSCNWMDQNQKFKKVLIIFMQSTQKSMTIVAGGMVPVSASTFISVIRSSYSLFAVLIQIT